MTLRLRLKLNVQDQALTDLSMAYLWIHLWELGNHAVETSAALYRSCQYWAHNEKGHSIMTVSVQLVDCKIGWSSSLRGDCWILSSGNLF